MNCRQSLRLFGAYWDDELTQAEREWLESHFASCDSCRSEYEQYAHSIELIGALPRVEVEPGLADRALARARRASPVPDRIPSSTPRWIPVTAAAALLVLAGATALQWTGGPLRSTPQARIDAPAVQQPVLVAGGTQAIAGTSTTDAVPSSDPTAVPDSLFDPSQDIEFILDPVTLRKGRAHPPSRLKPETIQGEQAVITF